MRALRVHEPIGPDGLRLDEIDVPEAPDDTAVRVAVHAAGVGFVDTLLIRGRYQMQAADAVHPRPGGGGCGRVGTARVGVRPRRLRVRARHGRRIRRDRVGACRRGWLRCPRS